MKASRWTTKSLPDLIESDERPEVMIRNGEVEIWLKRRLPNGTYERMKITMSAAEAAHIADTIRALSGGIPSIIGFV